MRNYPWSFYVLHVAANEINSSWGIIAWKANFAAEQNYAWYFRQHPAGGSTWDIGNSTAYQCFRPNRKVPTKWHRWISDPGSNADHLENQLIDSNGNIKITEYRAGTSHCTESLYPQNGNKLSQNGTKARDDNNCGTQTWQALFNYYYTGTLGAGNAPPRPNTSFNRPSGRVHLEFPAQVKQTTQTSNVGWRYQIDAYFPDDTPLGCRWGTIRKLGWSSKLRRVPTETNYDPPRAGVRPTDCFKYRARASNPNGRSSFASFHAGQTICPG